MIRNVKKGYWPKDTALDIVVTSFNPGVRRIMGRIGAYRPFALGHQDIKEMASITGDTKEIEIRSNHLRKQSEEFHKKEAAIDLSKGAKLGCFSQTTVDKNGHPMREEGP